MDAKEKNLNTVVSSVWPSIQLKRSFCTQACRARKALLKFLQNTNVGVILLLKICHHFNHPPSPIFCLSSLSCIFLYPHPFLQIILLGTSPRSPLCLSIISLSLSIRRELCRFLGMSVGMNICAALMFLSLDLWNCPATSNEKVVLLGRGRLTSVKCASSIPSFSFLAEDPWCLLICFFVYYSAKSIRLLILFCLSTSLSLA